MPVINTSVTVNYQNEKRVIKFKQITQKSVGIRIYNSKNIEVVLPGDVKQFLRDVNEHNNLGVDLIHQKTGKTKTTTQLGKDIIDALL